MRLHKTFLLNEPQIADKILGSKIYPGFSGDKIFGNSENDSIIISKAANNSIDTEKPALEFLIKYTNSLLCINSSLSKKVILPPNDRKGQKA